MFKLFRKTSARSADIKSHRLLQLSPYDTLTAGDLLNGGVLCAGGTGSGKTSGLGAHLGDAIVQMPRSGGVLHCAKPEDREAWTKLFSKAGRLQDLHVLSETEPLRINLLEYEANASGGHARNITRHIMILGESLNAGEASGGSDESRFFRKQEERVCYTSIVALQQAGEPVTAANIQRFIITAANSLEELLNAQWQADYHNRVMRAGYERQKSDVEARDMELAISLWLKEMPKMSEKTRGSITAGILGTLFTLNTGIAHELVGTSTNFDLKQLFEGRWLMVDMPPSTCGDVGTFVNHSIKYAVQREILRRRVQPGDNVITIWADEAGQFTNSFDAEFLSQCRSHQGCMVYLAQSVHSFYSVMKGPQGKHQANALLGQFRHKVMHCLSDVETAEWASSLVGKSKQIFVGGSAQRDDDAFGLLMGSGGGSSSFSEHFESILQPNEFMHGLRTGGPENDFLCDAIVIRSGKPFASGENFLKVAFSQR